MMVDQNTAVEQLWYTWSGVGLDTIRAGFRIRAASEGLQDYRSLRVQDLDRFQRYALPPDVNPVVITLNMAPVCLSLIDTGQERILVHKAYAGRDGVGRYGSFFVHLLAGLPKDFSALDAILLWRSSFWQTSDANLEDRRSTSLDRISVQNLKKMQKDGPLDPQSREKIKAYLPFVLQAYLTKKPLIDEKTTQTVPQKLYIAASDDDIARLISGLTCCLPKQLLKGLTFSTYEHDVTDAITEIVGTCWLSVPGAEKDPHVAALLPANYYTERLAVNCYIGKCSPLENNSLVEDKPLAAKFAQYATEYFMQGGTRGGIKKFEKFLDRARRYSDLDVDKFLSLYDREIVRALNPSKQDIELVLTPRSYPDCEYSTEMLLTPEYQRALLDLVMREPAWWWTFGRVAIINLCTQSAKVPMLAQALSQIAQSAIPAAVDIAKEGVPPTPRKAITHKVVTFTLIVDVMFYSAPPTVDADVWLHLLQELLAIHDVVVFLNTYMDMQGYHPFIEDLFQQLVQHPQQWPIVENFFAKLAEDTYQKKLRLLFILCDSAMGQYRENGLWLLRNAHLTTDEIAPFLKRYGPIYLPLANKMSSTVLELFEEMARNDVHQEKMHVLFHWLASPELFTWFDSSAKREKNLEAVLEAACLSLEETGEFFARYGQKYFKLYPRSPTLWNLFKRYAARGTQPRQPFIWIHPHVNPETLEQGLKAAHLTLDEKFFFLENYGEYYVPRYPQSQMIYSFIEEYLDCLRTVDIDIFRRSSSAEVASPTERFLWFLYQSSLQLPTRQLIYDWYYVGAFVRKASLLKEQRENIAGCIGRLFRMEHLPQGTRTKLIQELASACIEDEYELPSLINTLRGVLIPPDILLMLYDIAESAGESIRQAQDGEPLFVSCLQYALSFQMVSFQKNVQKDFVPVFLETLLLNVDEKTFIRLDAKAKKWPHEVYAEWQKKEPQHLFPRAIIEPSLFEQMKLWLEHRVALTQMGRALANGSVRKIVQVNSDYLTTLSSYPKEVPDVWWHQVDKALQALNASEDKQWQQFEYNLKLAAPSIGGKLFWLNSIKLWGQRIIALRQMRMALRSKHIGKIVRVATDHMITLQTYDAEVADDDERVADDWWEQLDAAFDFFLACEDAYESAGEDGEQTIINASNRIDALAEAGFPAPRLTMHEQRRTEAAKQFIAYVETQRMKVANKEKMLALSAAMVTQVIPVPPNAVSPKKQGISRFFGWFRK